jgi:hypothetical protein
MIQNKNSFNNHESSHSTLASLSLRASVLLVAGIVLMTGVGHGLENVTEQLNNKKRGTDGTITSTGNGSNESRTPREETGPHYTSYGSFSRTPARSGTF